METRLQSAEHDPSLSLYHLLEPEVLANPYPLYHRLQNEDPVHWDPFLHAWVVTRYADVVHVFQHFSAQCAPAPEQMEKLGLAALTPLAQVMVKQMLFLDQPAHGRLRGLASKAFTPRRIELLREHIQTITDGLLDACLRKEQVDIVADLAVELPTIINSEMLGVSPADRQQFKVWTADFAEVLGNFQHNPDRTQRVLHSLDQMCAYFHAAIRAKRQQPRDDLIGAFIAAEIDGDRLTDDEIVANLIIVMVGGQETTTNLIGNGLLTLLRHPDQLDRLQADRSLLPSAIEELLRYESPSQHTTRLATADVEMDGKTIQKRQAVIAVMGAANRDPARFPDPDTLDLDRQDNRHVAFGWASHFCFGAPLGRLEGRLAIEAVLNRMPNLALTPEPITWRENLGLRGLNALMVTH
jgi:cytochrome P450